MSNVPFNPLDKASLARAVAKALLEKPCLPLPPVEPFAGAGIYAIYYIGAFPAYQRISAHNRNHRFGAPIYVGRAVPKGGRKGQVQTRKGGGRELYDRLREHADSIEQANNLDLSDFYCRFLVVEDIWIPLGERLLMGAFKPLWNQLVEGFGNHDPGMRRKDQWRSDWDVFHAGRPWAEKLGESGKTPVAIQAEVDEFLSRWVPHEP